MRGWWTGVWLHAAMAAGVVVSLGIIVGWTEQELRRQHTALLELATDERISQLQGAAATVAQDFDDFQDDLDFAVRLIEQSENSDLARKSVSALLGSVRPYRLAATYGGPTCAREILVRDPRWTEPQSAPHVAALDRDGIEACRTGRPTVSASLPIGVGDLQWHRVYSRAGSSGAVALLIDTRPALNHLRTLSADASADLLVIGPHGRPAPITASRLAQDVDQVHPAAFEAILEHMRAGDEGQAVLGGEDAVALGYPDAELVVFYTPIEASGAPGWSAATVVSIAGYREHERRLILRVLASALAAGAVLSLLGAYVVQVVRTEAANRERLRGAEQIAHLRERAERILDQVPSGVVALGRGGVVTAANGAARRWAPGGFTTLDQFLRAATPAARAEVEALVRSAVTEGKVRSMQTARSDLFGLEGSHSIDAAPILPRTAEVEALLVVTDLTEVRRLQEQLLRVEKLSTVGILAAGIAHEVGTPLGVIRGRAELIARKLGPDHTQTRSLQVIVEQIDRITRTIRALLDFSVARPVEGARAVPVDVPIAQVCELVAYETEKRQVRLTVRVEPNLPPLRADADQIQQVLVNLVLNALDATPPGGEVVVSAAQVGGSIVLAVSDNGTGIPSEQVHQVFDPFFTTKKRGHGTGLGLAIVNQIARDHGGVVRVASETGRGTTVEVELPLEGGARAASASG